MERDAHYAAVGIATIALLAALAVFSIWLARLQFNSDYDQNIVMLRLGARL